MTVVAVPQAPSTNCPAWCARTVHSADLFGDDQHPEHHYGPAFGALSVEAVGGQKPYITMYEPLVDLSVSDLRQLATNARAAAEWLEAQP